MLAVRAGQWDDPGPDGAPGSAAARARLRRVGSRGLELRLDVFARLGAERTHTRLSHGRARGSRNPADRRAAPPLRIRLRLGPVRRALLHGQSAWVELTC